MLFTSCLLPVPFDAPVLGSLGLGLLQVDFIAVYWGVLNHSPTFDSVKNFKGTLLAAKWEMGLLASVRRSWMPFVCKGVCVCLCVCVYVYIYLPLCSPIQFIYNDFVWD